MYGTSEYQMVDALHSMIANGEIKREDFILQTKIVPLKNVTVFEKFLMQSWEVVKVFDYVDLLSFQGVSTNDDLTLVLDDSENGCMTLVKKYKEEGKFNILASPLTVPQRTL